MNETKRTPRVSNTRGTLSIAHWDVPDCGNSEWFINLKTNAHLDEAYGGYCVFAEVADKASLITVDKIAKSIASGATETVKISSVLLQTNSVVSAVAQPVLLRPEQVYEALGLLENHVSHMFLIGSRLWKTHKPSSDFDLLIVANESKGGKQKSEKYCCHAGQYDAMVMTSREFCRRLEAHEFHLLVVSSLQPGSPYILKGDPGSILSQSRFNFDRQRMFSAITKDVAKDWKKAQKFMIKGKLVTGKKILCHAMRSLYIALHLVQSGGANLGDIYVCNDLHAKLQSMYDKEWNVYDSLLRDKRDELISMLHEQSKRR